MSRDRREPPEANDRSAELLTAYVDGAGELPAGERRAVESWLGADPEAQADAAAVQGLLGRLRALPPDYDRGEPPDWAAMERSIRHAVAAEAPRPWWRNWKWLVPAMTCGAAAAVALALWSRPVREPVAVRVPVPVPSRAPAPSDEVVALWLDGSEVDVDLSRSVALGDPASATNDAASEAANETGDSDDLGLLPAAGMAWIDELDDAALDRAERLLAGAQAGATSPPLAGPPGSKG